MRQLRALFGTQSRRLPSILANPLGLASSSRPFLGLQRAAASHSNHATECFRRHQSNNSGLNQESKEYNVKKFRHLGTLGTLKKTDLQLGSICIVLPLRRRRPPIVAPLRTPSALLANTNTNTTLAGLPVNTTFTRLFSTSDPQSQPDKDNETPSFRSLVRRYGLIGGICYVAISAGTFWGLYFAILYFGFDANYLVSQLRPFCEKYGIPLPDPDGPPALPQWLTDKIDPVTFGTTFVITKFLFPFEIAATVMVTPVVARWYARRIGVKGGHH